jgi:DNA replication protein DnaC
MENNTQRVGKIVHISQLLPEQLKDPVSFDDVDLTEEETKQALDEARRKKVIRLDDERKKKLAALYNAEALKPWSTVQLWSFVKSRGDRMLQLQTGNSTASFQQIDFQKGIIKALLLYFTNNQEFEKLNTKEFNDVDIPFSLNKGIWLWGNPGVGKTLLMQMFRINKRLCFDVVQCPKFAYNYVKFGDDVINPYKKVVPADVASYDNFFQKVKGVCYNDLGTEPLQSKHYGNAINVMQTILLETYENKVPWWQRHVTTNLTFQQVEDCYGVRVKDRIRQCFNIIDIRGGSLRR